jgi:hypothetical protein
VEVEINNAIDIEFIEGQLLLNLFTWESCKKLVSSVVVVVRRIQAPSRDVETTTKWNKIKNELDNGTVIDHPRIFVNALKFMMECLSLAHIDAANARCVGDFAIFLCLFLTSFHQSASHRSRHAQSRY